MKSESKGGREKDRRVSSGREKRKKTARNASRYSKRNLDWRAKGREVVTTRSAVGLLTENLMKIGEVAWKQAEGKGNRKRLPTVLTEGCGGRPCMGQGDSRKKRRGSLSHLR